jgi:hypothetical protein
LIFYTWIIDWMKWASHTPEGDGVAGWLLLDGCSRLRHLESWITMLRNKY